MGLASGLNEDSGSARTIVDLPSTESAPQTLVVADAGTGYALEDRPPAKAELVVVNVPAQDATRHSALGLVAAYMGLVSSNSPWRSPWRVPLSHAELKRYFIGSVASDFGTWIQNTAQVLLAYELAHSAGWERMKDHVILLFDLVLYDRYDPVGCLDLADPAGR